MHTVNLLICQIISDVLAISFTLVFFLFAVSYYLFSGANVIARCASLSCSNALLFLLHMCFLSDDDDKMQELDEKSAQRDANTARPPARYKHTHTNRQDHLQYTAPL